MNIYYIMGAISLLIIFSYLFDAFARKTKFPSVILLIATGVSLRWLADTFQYHIPYLERIIPTFGTIGLILIVLEGALELEINKKKSGTIIRGFLSAFFLLIATSFALAYAMQYYTDLPFLQCMLSVTPLAIISSAVAIPSAAGLFDRDKEFVVYESTFSDILGIVMFYFLKEHLVNETTGYAFEIPKLLTLASYAELFLDIVLVILIAVIVTFLLLELIERISHNVKFFLILSILILAYVIAKKFHLSALIIIFFFGLFMANTQSLMPDFFKKYIPTAKADKGLHEFHILTAESTFLIRTGFFLFFGFNITVEMFMEPEPYVFGFVIIAIFLAIRFAYLFVTQPKNAIPVAFVAPRGLITILLFLDLPNDFRNAVINDKVLLIVILGSMLVMLLGLIFFGGPKSKGEVDVDLSRFGDVNR